ncbi:unnamed protein product [Schistocephalus solidus]|uniref:PHD-type domain-containing protein n=1 Tax=Schistocephalus solidus TaxID=70667 RepID=A0A183T2G3_SCHSO|nr:unnamed protein product [Schistocephalus solidus]
MRERQTSREPDVFEYFYKVNTGSDLFSESANDRVKSVNSSGDLFAFDGPCTRDTEVLSTLVVKLLNKARFWTRSDRWHSSLCRLIRTLAYNDPELMAASESLTIQQHQETVGAPKPKSSASAIEDCSLPLVPLNLRVKLFLFLLENLYAEYDAERLAKLNSSLNSRLQPSGTSSAKLGLVSSLSTDNSLHFKKESPDALSTKDAEKLDPSNSASPERRTGKEDLPPCSQPPLPHSLSPEVFGTSEQVEEEHEVLKATSPNGCLHSEAVPSAANEGSSPSTWTPSQCSSADMPAKTACESLEPSEDTGAMNVTHKSKRKSAAEGDLGAQPPRRSGRQRKPVEFLTMEAFNAPKSSKKKAFFTKKASIETNSEKHGKKNCSAVENGISTPVSKKKRRHRRRRGKQKSKRRKGSQPWMCSPSQSEGEDFQDAELDFLDSNAEDGSLLSSPSYRTRDWLDEVESDFDINACLDGEDSLAVKMGRNMERQKRRSSTAAAAEAAATEMCDDTPCQICAKYGSPEWLLLCDQCDLGFHAMCLRPELHFIPEGDWFCPRCLHARLLTDVAARLEELRVNKAKLEATSRMQERLNFVNVSVSNIINEDNRRAKAAARQSSRWYLDSSGNEDERGGESRSSSDAGSFINEESESSRRQRARHNLRHRRTAHSRAAAKRRRVSSDSDASSDSASYSSSSSSSGDRPPPVRVTRHRIAAQYDVNAAFKQLDVLLDADEKYASIKQARKERQSKKHLSSTDDGEEGHEVASSARDSVEVSALTSRPRKSKVLSSSNSEESAAEDCARRRRNGRSGSEDFRPDEEEEEEESNSSGSEDGTVSSSSTPSSDNWPSSRRARRKNAKRNRYSRKSSRRPVPRFEEDSVGSDDGIKPARRRATRRVNYKELNSEESQEEHTVDAEKSAVFENSSARTPPQSLISGRVRRILSDSEYEPSVSESPDDVDRREVEEEKEKDIKLVQPLQEAPLTNTEGPSPASSQHDLFSCDEDSGCGVGGGGLADAPDLSPKPGQTSSVGPLPSPVFEESETFQRSQAPLGSPQF